MKHTVTLPLRLPSVANKRMHWAEKAKLVASQRKATQLALDAATTARMLPMLVVTLTRVAPRALDGDNLQASLKGVRDQIAAHFQTADNHPGIEWRYAQAKGPVEVRIELELITPSLRLDIEGWRHRQAEYAVADVMGMRPDPFPERSDVEERLAAKGSRVVAERPVTTLKELAARAQPAVTRFRK